MEYSSRRWDVSRHIHAPPSHATEEGGSKHVQRREVTATLGLDVFYTHAYTSYERSTNENTDELIKRFLPKKKNFVHVSYEELKRIEYLLNTRPRKTTWRVDAR